jgi:hypothetical protein
MGELSLDRDSHVVVVGIVRPSIGRDLGSAEPRGVTLPSPGVVLSVSGC